MSLALVVALTLLGATGAGADQDEPILGRSSPIRPSDDAPELVELTAGDELRQQPRVDSAIVEILDTAVALPLIERRGPWLKVQFGAWQAWVQPGAGSTQSLHLEVAPALDRGRLERALGLLSAGVEPARLGPFTLYTDVRDGDWLGYLSHVSDGLVDAYRRRYQIDPGSLARATVVLFRTAGQYRQFEASEPRIAGTRSQGYTSERLSVLYVGRQPRDKVVSVLLHELTHLLNRHVFPLTLPPWLEEGMAQDLALCRVESDGSLQLSSISAVDSSIASLVETQSSSDELDLDRLLSLDWQTFTRFEARSERYAMSALLIRYLLDAGANDLAVGFRRYLCSLANGEEPRDASLLSWLEVDSDSLDSDFRRYLGTRVDSR